MHIYIVTTSKVQWFRPKNKTIKLWKAKERKKEEEEEESKYTPCRVNLSSWQRARSRVWLQKHTPLPPSLMVHLEFMLMVHAVWSQSHAHKSMI